MQKRPLLHPKRQTRSLFYICIAIIFTYSLSFAAFADNASPFLIYEAIENAVAAVALSVAGGLLFDIELRRAENKN